MAELPDLIGSDAQVQWAVSIRHQALHGRHVWTAEQAALLWQIQDSTWWIANREALPLGSFKPPSPAQLVGGDEVETPGHAPASTADGQGTPMPVRAQQAVAFAESVCHNTRLAEITILALMAKLYKGEMERVLHQWAVQRLDALVEDQGGELARDVKAVERILGRK